LAHELLILDNSEFPYLGKKIRTKIADKDCDEHDNERLIPVGTVGKVVGIAYHNVTSRVTSYTVFWENEAVTIWDGPEIEKDAEVLP